MASARIVVDTAAPQSSVNPLAAYQMSNPFPVTWSGSDNASGLASYDVYVSTNDATYTLWQSAVTYTSTLFAGMNDETYYFYSRARDNVGHKEDAPSVPDAVTQIRIEFKIYLPVIVRNW